MDRSKITHLKEILERKSLSAGGGDTVQRKARAYVRRCRGEGAVVMNGVKGVMHEKHYGTRTPRAWEKDDSTTWTTRTTGACVVYGGGEIVVVRGTVVKTVRDEQRQDGVPRTTITYTLATHGENFEVRKMHEFSEIPDAIKWGDTEISGWDFLTAVIMRGAEVYELV